MIARCTKVKVTRRWSLVYDIQKGHEWLKWYENVVYLDMMECSPVEGCNCSVGIGGYSVSEMGTKAGSCY
jgi:hypothetical protein